MNGLILPFCAGVWLLGFLGMWVSEGVFELGPGAVSFDLFSSFWIVGGLSYALLGFLAMSQTATRSVGARRER